MEHLVNRDFHRATDLINLRSLPLLYQVRPLLHHYSHLSAYFNDPRLKAAFTFQDGYMGLSPFEASATFSLMPYTELPHGVWYPKGGMYQIVEVLMEMARAAGVEFVFNAAVDQIEVSGDRARAIILADGQRRAADIIIANADLPYVYETLLPEPDAAARLAHKRFSCSVISFFWGVDQTYPAIAPHTLFLADDYAENFESIDRDLDLPEHPSLYVHAPARIDPSMAPPGEDTLIAIVPVGHLDETGQQDWNALRDRARESVMLRLAQLGIRDLADHLKFEVNYTPLSWRKRYNLMKGATHGLAHTLTQLGYLRPHNRHSRYHNLYFVGASTHPGTGVPSSLISARLVTNRVLDDLR